MIPAKKTLGTCIAIGVAVAVFIPGFVKIRHLNNRNKDLQTKNRRLQHENIFLRRELDRLQNDRVYQEKILREKMGVVRKDEVPVKIVPGN